ncbi:MAG: winged helix-turn-helix domain-containing protein [Methanotrichaceae archaeon]|nr:winged helix-turn-helix domain-containing protein [Methanotrichaceae archaeon]
MASYKERILEAIRNSKVGLTTVDVAKHADISKTTVIKYLSVLNSEGQVEFVEVGPSKLWKLKSEDRSTEKTAHRQLETKLDAEGLPIVDIDLCNGDDKTIYFSFRVKPEHICLLMKRANKCLCSYVVNSR